MSDQQQAKRPRTDQSEAEPAQAQLHGRDQLLLKSPELQTRLGKRYCDESELFPLLLSHGLVSRVRTIEVAVHPVGGDSFKVRVNAAKPSVGEAKAEIACVQGTEEARQELYRVAMRADGGAVREDDDEAEPLDEDDMLLKDGEMVAMAVKELPVWQTFAEGRVALSAEGAVATQIEDEEESLTTTGVELTKGKHYWEVELLSKHMDGLYIGISRPNLDPKSEYWWYHTYAWFMEPDDGSLYGNGKDHDDEAGGYEEGDRVGVLLDLDKGSLCFFKNGVRHGPGYAAGSVTGPVALAVRMLYGQRSVRLLSNAQPPQ
jgi:hypothetical protein